MSVLLRAVLQRNARPGPCFPAGRNARMPALVPGAAGVGKALRKAACLRSATFPADAASPGCSRGRDPPPRELSGSEPGLLPPGLEVGPAAVGHFRLARLFLRALGKLRHETEMNVGGRELL